MAVTVLTDASVSIDSRTLTWTIPTLAVGDVVVVVDITWDNGYTMNTPSGTGLTFTAYPAAPAVSGAGHTTVYQWAATAASGGSSVVVTSSVLAGGSSVHNGVLFVFPAADGYSLAATPNTLTVGFAGGATATGTLTGTTTGNIGVVALGDWTGSSGASRAWSGTPTEDLYISSSGNSTHYFAHYDLAAGSNTVGLTAPSAGSTFSLAGIEILLAAGGGGAPDAVHAPSLLRPPGGISPAARRTPWSGSFGDEATTPIADGDTASGADDGTLAASITGTDVGTSTDTGALSTATSATDTASGVDTASLAASQAGTDTGAGADSGTLAAGQAASDTATGTDTASLVVSITASDTATAVDAVASLDTGATPKAGADTASGVDTATTATTVTGTDTASGVDTGSVGAGIAAADTATAVESAFVTVILTGADNATAADLAGLAASVAAADLATVLESASYVDTGLVVGPAPPERTLVVEAESRTLVVERESRVLTVEAETRTMEA